MIRFLYYLSILVSVSFALEQEAPIVLIGSIILPDKIIDNGTLVIINQRITAVGEFVSIPKNARVVHTNGIILPGLIDLHNHLTWNIFPRWKPSEEFGSRYDWQQKAVYKILMQSPHQSLVDAGLLCKMQRYAEVKAVTQGATSVIGSLRKPCNQGLARNLDDDPTLGEIIYDVFPLQMSEKKLNEVNKALSSNGSLFIHIAEGSPNDATANREFRMLKGRDLLKPGVSIIHGVALKYSDFYEMANASVGFVWSPRSNVELYGDTADLEAAIKNRVVIAIAPDWSPTGSDGILSELNYASAWNSGLDYSLFDDRSLLDMATSNAAKLVHLEQRLGKLEQGYLADILVLQTNNSQSKLDPSWVATHAIPEDVALVIIDGQAVYGDPKIMNQLIDNSYLESLNICGIEKSISFLSHHDHQVTFKETQDVLKTALRHLGRKLAPLSECGN